MESIPIGGPAFRPETLPLEGQGVGSSAKPGFVESLADAINNGNETQAERDRAITDMVTGDSHSVHQTMIAIQHADHSFQLMMQVRNKIVSAYEEITRIQR